MKRLLIASVAGAALACGLAACATPTAFAPAGPSARASGFWDSRIEENRYRISYRGGSGAPPALVRDYALLHAADLTVAGGYDWFQVIGGYGEAGPGSGSSLSIGGGSSSFGRRSYSGVGVGFTVPLGGGPQLTETLEVVMGTGPKPQGASVYDARGVQASIRPRVIPTSP